VLPLLNRPVWFDATSIPSAEGKRAKSEGVADAINKLLQNLVIKCAKSEGIRDYYHVGVIGMAALRLVLPLEANSQEWN